MTIEDGSNTSPLEQSLRQVEAAKAGSYTQRTHHKDSQGKPLFINRLIHEDSPYLLQHAHNPVNWYAWGDEAFNTARAENKPIFLSIGYSTCHWCHVMEAESFDNIEVAKLLNQSFICIKLDREQYPDIDEIYMTGVQIMTGQGGWPMSNFILPDGKPFYSATYFPAQQFMALLSQISSVWHEKRADLEQSAAKIHSAIEQILADSAEVRALEMSTIEASADEMLQSEDTTYGGLAGAPKFPQEPLLAYFLEGAVRQRDLNKAGFVTRALDAMARGGIYDQVGGGFHRYSTDAQWLVPHFEKMLYNQSQLTRIYLTAWQVTGNRFFQRVVRQTLDYVMREMQIPQGGFYSATDADSEDVEGIYFIWSLSQLAEHLTEAELAVCNTLYELKESGNFEGANILALRPGLDQFSDAGPSELFEAELDQVLLKLRSAREQRIPPLRDDKLIVAWSAAMATSFAWSGFVLHEPAYIKTAEKAVNFMWDNNYAAQDSLRRIYLDGLVSIPAQLEDYVNLIEALVALFDVTKNNLYLNRAAELMTNVIDLFWNEKSGGFFLSQQLEQGPSIPRSSSASDNATLSAYGVVLQCLISLARRDALFDYPDLESRFAYQEKIQQGVNAVSAAVADHPANHPTVIRSINLLRQGSIEPIQYASEGLVRACLVRSEKDSSADQPNQMALNLSLNLLPGVHITAFADEESELIPLSVGLALHEKHWKIIQLISPSPEPLKNNPELKAYQGDLELEIILQATGEPQDLLSNSIGVILQVQVCTDELCLPLETLSFRV